MLNLSALSNRDSLLFGIPLLLLLVVGFFRLDELIARRPPSRHHSAKRRGSKIGCDPDGAPLDKRVK